MISNFYSRRQFNGNINQKLYIKFMIKNPLLVNLEISSIKLLCDFVPEKKEKEKENEIETKANEDKAKEDKTNEKKSNNIINNEDIEGLIYSEEKCNLLPMQESQIELSISSSVPGKIIVKGLSLVLFTDSKIIHLFNKKNKNKLYQHKHKSASTDPNASGIKRKISTDSNSASEQTSRMSSSKSGMDTIKNMLSMQINKRNVDNFSKKSKIEYIVKDFNDDIFLNFPIGLDIDIYLYQLIFFPIIINNTSTKNRIRRFSLFIESIDDRKLKTFYNYITKDIEINQEHSSQKILIPLLPISNDDKHLYVKVLIKCADEMRIYPIEIRRFIIKLNIKDSISFEIKESYNNLNSFDKKNHIFKQIDFSLKTDIRIKNKNDIKNISIKDPILNDKLILSNRHNYKLNDSDIHEIFRFNKDENIITDTDTENKNKFDFILNNKEMYGMEVIDDSNNHIFDKFNKIVNSTNQSIIFFPWNAEIDGGKKIEGFYLYELNLSGPKLTKDFIREIFYNSTKINIIKQKVNSEKTLIVINVELNKNGIASLSEIISQYDIFIDNQNPEIDWLGLQKYTIINKLDKKGENKLLCKFNFMTTLKGVFEINRIGTKLYRKNEEKNNTEVFMQINHITKPLCILID
jgi:hypothetical protein